MSDKPHAQRVSDARGELKTAAMRYAAAHLIGGADVINAAFDKLAEASIAYAKVSAEVSSSG